MTQSKAAPPPSRSRPRSYIQSSGPTEGEQSPTASRRLSLGRSNAVSHKPRSGASPTDLNDDLEFSYVPGNWTHPVEPNNMRGPSDLFAFLRGARAKRNQNGASTGISRSRDNRQGSRLSTDLSQQSQNKPVCEDLSTEDSRLLVSKQENSRASKIVPAEGPWTAKVRQHQDENINHDFQQQHGKFGTCPDTQALESKVEALEKLLEEQKALLHTTLEDDDDLDTNTKDFNTMAGEIKSRLQEYESLLTLLSSLGPALCTRRGVMLLKAMQHQQKEHPKSVLKGGNGVDGFDDILSIREVTDISQALDTRPDLLNPKSTCIRVCAICNIPRFVRVLSDHTTTSSLQGKRSEFSSVENTTQCCWARICDACFIPGLVANFVDGWWSSLDCQGWLKCPVPTCGSLMPIFFREQLRDLLQQLGDKDWRLHEAQFARCVRLRDALRRLAPRPTVDAMRTAAALHRRLVDHGWMVDHGRMASLSDISSTATTIQMVPVDTPDGTEMLQVPIFVENLIRKTTTECIVCTESLADIAGSQEDEEQWSAAIQGFPADWPSQIRPFPSQSILPVCSALHALDICRSCLSQHIKAHLDCRGIAGCESLTCPTPGCGHHFTHQEVRLLADPEVFARYDKLKLLSVLSADPDFRWCLREGCEMGQIYQILDQRGDGPFDRRRNHVECEECSFEMCFGHQIPWHRGLSCDEYDRMKKNLASNNSNDVESQQWLLRNAKTCRCGAYVEKQGGCFHMTCSSCGFEFCWECMADWTLIRAHGMEGYNRLAHAPGCWFRRPNATSPNQLHGDTLEDALQRFRR
ncbi:hypothetical protein V8F06_000571 [Rhypophila decipiens]